MKLYQQRLQDDGFENNLNRKKRLLNHHLWHLQEFSDDDSMDSMNKHDDIDGKFVINKKHKHLKIKREI